MIALGAGVMDREERMTGRPTEMMASREPRAGEMDAYERILGEPWSETRPCLHGRTMWKKHGALSIRC